MYGIDDKDWLKTYIWGEITLMDMELFEHNGKIWTNNELDKECTKEVFDKLVPVIYGAIGHRLNIYKLNVSGPTVEKYRNEADDPSVQTFAETWMHLKQEGFDPMKMLIEPERRTSPDTALRLCISFMDKFDWYVEQLITELKEAINSKTEDVEEEEDLYEEEPDETSEIM